MEPRTHGLDITWSLWYSAVLALIPSAALFALAAFAPVFG